MDGCLRLIEGIWDFWYAELRAGSEKALQDIDAHGGVTPLLRLMGQEEEADGVASRLRRAYRPGKHNRRGRGNGGGGASTEYR